MATPDEAVTHEMCEAAREATRASARAANEVHALESYGHPAALLGTVRGGRALAFDESQQVFLLGGRLCSLEEVRSLDAQAKVRWRFLEQRDWMRRLDDAASAAAFERACERLGQVGGVAGLDEQIRQHVKKNDSYLHGHIVDTNEEEAVAEAMAKEARAAQQAEEKPDHAASEAKKKKEREAKRVAFAKAARGKISGIKMRKSKQEKGLQ